MDKNLIILSGAVQKKIEESIGVIYFKSDHTALAKAISDRNRHFTFEVQVGTLGKLSPDQCLILVDRIGDRGQSKLRSSETLIGMRMRHTDSYENAEGIFSRKNISRVKQALSNIRNYEYEILEASELGIDDPMDAGLSGHDSEDSE